MQFAAALSRAEQTDVAAEQLCDSLRRQLSKPIDLLLVFFSAEHRKGAAVLLERLQQALTPRVLVGCMGEGVIGGDREIEREPAISVLAGHLPNVTLTPFHIGLESWEDVLHITGELGQCMGIGGYPQPPTRGLLAFGDPFTTPITEFLGVFDALLPGIPIVGGMVSGASKPGESVLFLNSEIWEEGLVGVRIAGDVRLDVAVSQGCKPVGEKLLITHAEGHFIQALGGKNAYEVARTAIRSLPASDRRLVENGLFMGITLDEYQTEFGMGDFLVRNILGVEPFHGILAVGENVRAGQTVQFHLRDSSTASQDLRQRMALLGEDEVAPSGALLVSCNGRGVRLFEMPSHDVRAVLEAVPETPLTGFFAQGELGPVGNRNFIHGHTACVLLFRPLR